MTTWVSIGMVRSIHPGRRELRVAPKRGCDSLFEDMAWVRVMLEGKPVRCKVAAAARHGGEVILTLAPGVPRDLVGRMRHAPLVCAEEERDAAKSGAWDVAAMIGWRVLDEDGCELGRIAEAYLGPANAAITVERTGGGGMILPLVEALVLEADETRGILRVGDTAPYAVELEEEEDA